MMMYLNRDMDGGPFLVYFLPILGGQKAAMLDLHILKDVGMK
jgi:hypothetical protein